MKKLSILLAVCVLLSSFAAFSVDAAHSDFDVRDGVLVKYSGSDADVTLPSYVTAVGPSAFEGNTTVQTLTVPASVYSIGVKAFDGCTSLQRISGGENITETGDFAFRNTPYLEQSTVKYLILGHVLLWYNGTADSVTIPMSCTAVAPYAFLRCEYLKSFTAYDGLISVGTGAFYGCSSLETVNLPSTVSAVGGYAFDGTPYLKNAGEFATVGDGVLIRYQGSDTQVEIPDTVRRIASHAFSSSKLTSVTIPDSVYAVDAYAFADCVGLSQLSLSDGLVSVGNGAFRGSKSLTKLKTPISLSYIGQGAFGGSALQSAALRGKDLTVSYNAFKDCTDLDYVLLSEDTAAVLDGAFDGCTALKGISVPSEIGEVSENALSNCPKVTVTCEEGSKAQTALRAHNVNTVLGDTDADGCLSIVDATLIQYYIAELFELDGAQTVCADYDFDGEISITDAFMIQLQVAGLL